MKYYKILNKKEYLDGIQFHTGRVDHPNPGWVDGSMFPNGINFTPVTTVLSSLHFGPYIREVTISEGVNVLRVFGMGPEKCIASSIILGEQKRWDDPGVLQQLIHEGARLKYITKDVFYNRVLHGDTPFVFTVLTHTGLFPHLIQDIDKSVIDYALCLAARQGHTEMVKLFLDHGADVHTMGDEPFQQAVMHGYSDIVECLLEAGADVHIQMDFAYGWAARHEDKATVGVLAKYGLVSGGTFHSFLQNTFMG